MAYEILALDVDGTLVNSKKEVSKATKEALIDIQKQGIKVVIASGRSTAGIMPVAKEIWLNVFGGYILSYNGGMITNCETGETVYSVCLPEGMVPEIYDFSVKHKTGIMTYHNNEIIAENDADRYIQIDAKACGINIHVVDDFPKQVTYPVNKCLLTGEPHHLEQVEPLAAEEFKGRLSVYRSEGFYLEMMPLGIDKGYGMSRLLRIIGLKRSQMIACGDGYNDIPMIEYAGLGVAMGNAHDSVKLKADYIAQTHDEDGIIDVINRFIKGR